mmetsp:Transcript_56261/g.131801  ORF Transcript_56261/g.131801 Transcript_56261/m.131801 type:complete len:464 (-) Transcript_56261:70-1461(-)
MQTDTAKARSSFVRGRVPNSLVLSGFLLLIILMIIPVWESASLLADFNYIFWAGHWEPQTIILLCMGVLVGYVVSAFLYSVVDPDWTKHDASTAFFVHMFVSMVGLVYLFGALGMMKQANEISMNLMDHCAHSGLSYNTFLYSQVLHRMRRRPGCDEKMSVEECEGFTPVQPYLDYLRSAEQNFRCSGFCYEAPGEEELKVIENELEGKTVGNRVVSRWPWPDGGEEKLLKIAAAPAAAKPAQYLALPPHPADESSSPFSLLEGQARTRFLQQEGDARVLAAAKAAATRSKRKHAAMLLGLAAAAGEKQEPEMEVEEKPMAESKSKKAEAKEADAEEEEAEGADEEGEDSEEAAGEEGEGEKGAEEDESTEEKKALKVTVTKEFGPPPAAFSKAKIVWNYTYAPTLFSRANFPLSCHGMAARDLTDHAGAYGELLCFQGLCLIAGASFAYVLKVIRICIRKDF